MNAAAFDSYDAVKQLRDLGMDEPQAQAIVKIVISNNDAKVSDLATKADIALLRSDITDVRSELKADITDIRSGFKADITDVRSGLKADITDLRSELKADIANVKSDLELKIEQLKTYFTETLASSQSSMVRWTVGSILTATAVIISAIKIF
jgi:hypothetical protein